jgi:glycosyltransferase involved in cell wall biosynthesis
MILFLNVLTILTLVYWITMFIDSSKGLPLIHKLPKREKRLEKEPFVSIIVAAKEEEESIIQTVKHLLYQDYKRMELIVVNDRSQDLTGQKLEDLKKWSAAKKEINVSLQVIHITSLPEGWLGKNHALYQGYLQAKGEYLLFTDADVIYQPHALQDAISYIQDEQADHLVLAPAMITKTFWLRSFVHFFLFSFGLFLKPWKGNIDTQTKDGMGIGAFNLIHRKAYQKIGTHKALALRPDDDLQLGIRVKRAGLKQRVLTGLEHIAVEWYPNLYSAVRGLEKNTFAGLKYSLTLVFIAIFGQFFALFFPFIAVWLFRDWNSLMYLLSIIIMIGLYFAHIRKMTPYSGFEVIVLPITVLLFIYVLIRSTYVTLRQGGIYWRGTYYSLHELKKMNKG